MKTDVSICNGFSNPAIRSLIGDNAISRKNKTRKGNSFSMGGVAEKQL
jgi:hypothetical protein